jgi:hypothetical protein
MATQGRAPVAALGGLVMLLGGAVHAAEPAKPRAASAPAAAASEAAPPPASPGAAPASSPAASPGEAVARAEAQAGAAQRAAQDLEAQVIELRRTLQALDRQRDSFDDIRRRLDELDGRLAENERQDAALTSGEGREAGAIRFRDDGVAIRSPGGRFLLRPHLRLQALYQGVIAEQGPADEFDPNTSGFSLFHAEVILEGHAVSSKFEYRLQIDFAEPQPINDAFVQWRALRSLVVRAGQFKIPYGFQRWVWSGELEFTDISTAMQNFSLGRDLGLMLLGRPLASRLQYELAITNGSGTGQPNDNVDLAYTARVVAAPFGPLPLSEGDYEWQPSPLVSGGIAGQYNLRRTDIRVHDPTASIDIDDNDKIDNIAVWQGGVELRALWRGAALQAEGFGRLERPGVAGPDRKFWGGYLQASYFLLPQRLQVAGRLARSDQPYYGIPNAEIALHGTAVDEQAVAVSAYFHGHHAKLQVEYGHLRYDDATSTPDVHRVRAAIQLWF